MTMDRSRFIEIAPYYYALAIASEFRELLTMTATKIAIRGKFWSTTQDHNDFEYNFLEKDILFDEGIAILLRHEMLKAITDDFGPPIYIKAEEFDAGWEALSKDERLPFFKFSFDSTGNIWLRAALRSVNSSYDNLGIEPSNFEKPDLEWQPLPLDRTDPHLKKVIETLDQIIEEVRSNNGYSASVPEERAYVLDGLQKSADKLRSDTITSWGYLKKNGSSAESVGELGFRQLAKLVIEHDFYRLGGSETV
jgi:hypothetical protein